MNEHAEIARHFKNDYAEATLKEQREDGLYRHIEFTAPKTMNRLIMVTWPYNLLVAGSHGSYHFERFGQDTEDMFAWLRRLRVDPNSWASKLVNGRDSVSEYDRSLMVEAINERVADAVENDWVPEGLQAAVRENVLDSHLLDTKDTAFHLVSEFQHGVKYRAQCTCGAREERDSYGSALTWKSINHNKGNGHNVDVREVEGFAFDDFTEWDVDKLNYHFVYQCHAAVWGIAQYDAAKATKAVAA